MIIREDLIAGTVRKRAESEEEGVRLRHEREVLEALAHPGVVRLIQETDGASSPSEIVTSLVIGRRLADARDLTTEEIAGIGASVATTLADIHRLGFVHRAVNSKHILLDAMGRPVLCGFGESRRSDGGAAEAAGRRDDLMGLTGALLSVCPPGTNRLVRAAARFERSQGWDGRDLAVRLVRSVPGARLPGEASAREPSVSKRSSPPRYRSSRSRSAIAGGALGGVLALAVLTYVVPGGHARRSEAERPPAVCGSAVPGSCAPMIAWPVGSEIDENSRLYRIVGANPVETFLGRWGCDSTRLPVALDRKDGDIWAFDSLPAPGARTLGRLVAHIGHATGASVRSRAGGCDTLLVSRQDAAPVEIRPAQA